MTATGYESARYAAEQVAQSIREAATLIGEDRAEAMTFSSGVTLRPGLGLLEDASILSSRARDLEQGLFTIIVVGEFKNGKSTLLNAMLGSKTLPAKAAPATAIITVLTYGDRTDVAIYESGRPEPRLVSWEEFVREFQLTPRDQESIQEYGTLDRFSQVEYAEMECRHDLCGLGVKLIDSPGLGEHISRTRVATNFLRRSQAAIMVLNATRILTRDERLFIDTVLGEGRLNHVFFVVNRIDLVDEQSRGEIKRWVRSQLTPHFVLSDGSFDEEMFRRRVFYLDSRSALVARSIVPQDENQLAASGLPALEVELERFLTSEDKVAAALQSTRQIMQPVMAQAERRIEAAQMALDAPLATLEQRREEAERRLQDLERQRQQTEQTITRFADVIKRKVYADLRAYVEEMGEHWEEDSRRWMDLDRALPLRDVIAAYAQREARERIASAINEEVQRYVQTKFTQWSDRIAAVIQGDVEALIGELEAQIEDLQLELGRIADAFAGRSRSRSDSDAGPGLFRLALSAGDIAGITEDVMAVNGMTDLVAQVVQQSIVVQLVRTLIQGSLLMTTVLVEILQAGVSESEVKRRIRRALGERLNAGLREQVHERQGFIYRAVEERFEEFARRTTNVLRTGIGEVRAEQERILERKRDEHFSVEQEKQRLSAIGQEMRRLNDQLTVIA